MNWKLFIKIGLSALALFWVARQVDMALLVVWLEQVPVLFLVGSFLLYNVSKVAGAWRLHKFFHASGAHITTRENLLLYYKGMFYNLFLPGGIGGDGYKIVIISKALGISWRNVFKAVLWDRVSGAVALLFLSLLLVVLLPALDALPLVKLLVGVATVLVFPVFYGATRWLAPEYAALAGWGNGLALTIQSLQGVAALLLFAGMHVAPGEMGVYVAVFFVSSLATIAPVTLGGIGVRELVFVLAARYLSIEQNKAVAFSMLFFSVNAVSALAGAFVTVRFQKKETSDLPAREA
ncbi:lysylphosphatidylglycerol synthase transmembrane domain-containing protein [Chryseolinea lacunae]|uniref:Flippase-like domain-containing protein n=1 Tax=Chryseolinea lacunae TaxID=2801331 RepID=A0ABS1KZ26_9BACT|nr:lysylphosphatidylglycerol synthase transmembrane domain-containing protein [Chryseolinea lacunae]MBL0744721.1 flippase-like domain-containing protein [Chryseolinea lacunae]